MQILEMLTDFEAKCQGVKALLERLFAYPTFAESLQIAVPPGLGEPLEEALQAKPLFPMATRL